jgi:predicted deacetylase
VFAAYPIEDVSNRYTFIPTISIVDVFRDSRWYLVEVKESSVRTVNKKGYQKHLIRFRHLDHILTKEDDIPETILTNSHDKTSSFIIKLGVFRKRTCGCKQYV